MNEHAFSFDPSATLPESNPAFPQLDLSAYDGKQCLSEWQRPPQGVADEVQTGAKPRPYTVPLPSGVLRFLEEPAGHYVDYSFDPYYGTQKESPLSYSAKRDLFAPIESLQYDIWHQQRLGRIVRRQEPFLPEKMMPKPQDYSGGGEYYLEETRELGGDIQRESGYDFPRGFGFSNGMFITTPPAPYRERHDSFILPGGWSPSEAKQLWQADDTADRVQSARAGLQAAQAQAAEVDAPRERLAADPVALTALLTGSAADRIDFGRELAVAGNSARAAVHKAKLELLIADTMHALFAPQRAGRFLLDLSGIYLDPPKQPEV